MTDFGKGFYVTPNLHQAKEWAQVKAHNPQINPTILEIMGINKNEYLNHPETKIPAYLTFNLNLHQLLQLNGLIFPMPDEPHWHKYKEHWQAFVQNCRIGLKHYFDFVYGPVGGRHKGSFSKVKPSYLKEQLSLNSLNAIQCLSNLKITISSHKYTQQVKIDPHRLRKFNDIFLKRVIEVLMSKGRLSYQDAIELINHSWVAKQIENKESIIWHEHPEYWAFFILFESNKLWYQEYETYLTRYQVK